MRTLFLLLVFIIIIPGCSPEKKYIAPMAETILKKEELSKEEKTTWQYKDIVQDTIPGISLDRAYNEIPKYRKAKGDVIIAMIDSGLDIHHDDIKEHLWTNDDETDSNGIDDDGNGYIDDIHGWNFIGNSSGQNLLHANLEITRIVRKYGEKFKDKTENEIPSDEVEEYQKYNHYIEEYNKELERIKSEQNRADYMIEWLERSQKFVKEKLGKTSYTLEEVEQIIARDSIEERDIAFIKNLIVRNLKPKDYYNYRESRSNEFNYEINLNYNDREIVGDDPYDITDVDYGNNNIVGFPEKETHSIRVSSMITSYRSPDKKISGFSDHIKIMPLRALPGRGEAYDKDVALAIRYAVDNGAKVINMSFGKAHFTHKQWVLEAIKYAQEKDVLIVNSAGNKSLNIDEKEAYLDDTGENNSEEITDNFIKVGASTHTLDKNLIAPYSNYGTLKVDIFAPGHDVYTIRPDSENRSDRGTSLSSAIVSGIAALVRVYYPNLSAAEVKDVILRSGVSYDIMVNVPGTDNKEEKLFSELSKSGKIVNVYNALLMAEKMAK